MMKTMMGPSANSVKSLRWCVIQTGKWLTDIFTNWKKAIEKMKAHEEY